MVEIFFFSGGNWRNITPKKERKKKKPAHNSEKKKIQVKTEILVGFRV
jgi:hypothetical protein